MKRKLTTVFTLLFLILGVAALAIGTAVQDSEACGTTCCGGQSSTTIPDCDEEAGETCECTCSCKTAGCSCNVTQIPELE